MTSVKISALGPLKKKIVASNIKTDAQLCIFDFIDQHFGLKKLETSRYNFIVNGKVQKGSYTIQDGDSIVVLKMGGAG